MKTVDQCTSLLASEILSRVILEGVDIVDREAPLQIARRGYAPMCESAPRINPPRGDERFYVFFRPAHLLDRGVDLSAVMTPEAARQNLIDSFDLLAKHAQTQQDAAEKFLGEAIYRALDAYKLLCPDALKPAIWSSAISRVSFVDPLTPPGRQVLVCKTTITVFCTP